MFYSEKWILEWDSNPRSTIFDYIFVVVLCPNVINKLHNFQLHMPPNNSSPGTNHHIESKFQLNLHQILLNVQKCAKKSSQLQFRQIFLRSQSSQNKNDDNKQSIHNMNINRVVRHIKYTRKKNENENKNKSSNFIYFY